MSPDDPARDPHLDAALRHAPDRDDAPSPALSRAILEAARAAATPARPWWRRWLEVQPMQWAGVAAGLLVAVLGGRLWWDNPPELREPAPAVAPRAAAPAQAPAAAPAAAPAEAASPAPGTAQESAGGALPPAPLRKEARKTAPAAPPPPAEDRQPAAAAAADKTVAAARPVPPAPAPAPTVLQAAPAPAAADTAVAPAPARGLAQDTRRKQEAGVGSFGASAPMAEASPPETRLAPAGESAVLGGTAGVDPPGLQRLRHAAEAASGWSWEGRAPQPTADAPVPPLAREAWLQQLLQASSGRWTQQAGSAQPPGESLAWIGTWRENGELRALVSLQGRRLWWREPDGSTWTATLDPAAAQALARPPR